jgi:hypothetical protein
MRFTVKIIDNETGEEVRAGQNTQTDGGIILLRASEQGREGWCTCGFDLEEVLDSEHSVGTLAIALMTAAKNAARIAGEHKAEFMAALSSEFINLVRSTLPSKAAAEFMLVLAEEAAKRACEEMEMPV